MTVSTGTAFRHFKHLKRNIWHIASFQMATLWSIYMCVYVKRSPDACLEHCFVSHISSDALNTGFQKKSSTGTFIFLYTSHVPHSKRACSTGRLRTASSIADCRLSLERNFFSWNFYTKHCTYLGPRQYTHPCGARPVPDQNGPIAHLILSWTGLCLASLRYPSATASPPTYSHVP